MLVHVLPSLNKAIKQCWFVCYHHLIKQCIYVLFCFIYFKFSELFIIIRINENFYLLKETHLAVVGVLISNTNCSLLCISCDDIGSNWCRMWHVIKSVRLADGTLLVASTTINKHLLRKTFEISAFVSIKVSTNISVKSVVMHHFSNLHYLFLMVDGRDWRRIHHSLFHTSWTRTWYVDGCMLNVNVVCWWVYVERERGMLIDDRCIYTSCV